MRICLPKLPLIRIATLSLALGSAFTASPARGQPADSFCAWCPVPDSVTARPTSRLVDLIWDEIPRGDGRTRAIVAKVGFDSLSSEPALEGSYALDCDYRLSISPIAEPANALNLQLRLLVERRANAQGLNDETFMVDTLTVPQADSAVAFDPEIAGDLAIRFTSNVSQPPDPLGSPSTGIPVSVSGLNTSNSRVTRYRARALNSVQSLSEGLQVEVKGPLGALIPIVTVLNVSTPASRFPIMNGMELSFGDGACAAGDSVLWSANHLFDPNGSIEINMESFEGYHVWRSELPGFGNYALLGEIRHCESKFDFVLLSAEELSEVDISLDYDPVGRVFTLSDRDITNDFPYQYAVSTFDRGFLGNPQDATFEGTLVQSVKLYPALPNRTFTSKAFAYPNPYKRSAYWEEQDPKIVFANLPPQCTIRIFTVAADLVTTLRHGPGEPISTSSTSAEWDLRTARGEDIVPGIYIFFIEGTNFRQEGKVMVVR